MRHISLFTKIGILEERIAFELRQSSVRYKLKLKPGREAKISRVSYSALIAVLTLAAASYSGAVLAWGMEGHQVIALLAQSRLTPNAQAAVMALLAQENGATLVSEANWADQHRTPQTAPWHYVNFPRGDCHYVPERDCPTGQCVVEAIRHEAAILGANTGAVNDVHRLHALKYVVHFVGDIHQPLHAGLGDDRGGNTVSLTLFMQTSNLHAAWDSGLIHNLQQDTQALAQRLDAFAPDLLDATQTGWDPAQVAEESCKIVNETGFYPGTAIGADYIQHYTPVLERRLQLAAARLAQLLNQLFP